MRRLARLLVAILAIAYLVACQSISGRLHDEYKETAKLRSQYMADASPRWWDTINSSESAGALIILESDADGNVIEVATNPSDDPDAAMLELVQSSTSQRLNARDLVCIWVPRAQVAIPPNTLGCDSLVSRANRSLAERKQLQDLEAMLGDLDSELVTLRQGLSEVVDKAEALFSQDDEIRALLRDFERRLVRSSAEVTETQLLIESMNSELDSQNKELVRQLDELVRIRQ